MTILLVVTLTCEQKNPNPSQASLRKPKESDGWMLVTRKRKAEARPLLPRPHCKLKIFGLANTPREAAETRTSSTDNTNFTIYSDSKVKLAIALYSIRIFSCLPVHACRAKIT